MAQVIYKRLPHCLLKQSHEMPSTQSSEVGSILYSKRIGIVILYELKHRPETPDRVLCSEPGLLRTQLIPQTISEKDQNHL